MNILAAARRIIGHQIHTLGPALPQVQSCPATQAVHRDRDAAFRNTTAALLAEFGPALGRRLPAVERIVTGMNT